MADGGGPVAARMREVAGRWLYRRNAFRALGLAEVPDQAVLRTRRAEAAGALASGARLPAPADPAGTGVEPAEEAYVRLAVDTLADPLGQLVHELFWPWGERDLGCRCPPDLHRVHDRAVLAHLKALEWDLSLELEVLQPAAAGFDPRSVGDVIDAPWAAATVLWGLATSSDDLWGHLRHRAAVLGVDPGPAAVEDLRAQLPHALVGTAADLAVVSSDVRRLIVAVHRWDVPAEVADAALAAAAERVRARAEEHLAAMPGASGSAEFGAMVNLFLEDLRRHADLAPGSSALDELRDEAALVVTETAIGYLDDRATPRAEPEPWFAAARQLATTPELHDRLSRWQRTAVAERRSVLARLLRWGR